MRYTVNQQLHVKVLALPEVPCYIFCIVRQWISPKTKQLSNPVQRCLKRRKTTGMTTSVLIKLILFLMDVMVHWLHLAIILSCVPRKAITEKGSK